MKFFAPSIAGSSIGESIAYEFGESLSNCKIDKFSDGEISCEILDTVRGEDCFIIQSICDTVDNSINDHLMQVMFLKDALKRASAKSINLVIPYLGYARQDRRNNKRQPISSKVVANMLSQHVDHIYTMDLHSDQIEGFFEIPVDNLSFKNIIYESLGNRKEATSESLVIVAPDMGSAHRVHRLAKLLKLPMVVADKRRDKPNSVSDMTLVGDVVDKTAIIIDDLIDTGNTLIKAGNLLKNEGAKKIVVFATHGVFSGPAFKNLLSKDTPFNEIHIANTKPIIVDSVYFDSEKSKKIINIECSFYVHNISHIFYEAIKNNYSCKSVSTSII